MLWEVLELFGDVLIPKNTVISLLPDVEFRHPYIVQLLWLFPPCLQSKESIAKYANKFWEAKIQWNVIMHWATVLFNQSLVNTI